MTEEEMKKRICHRSMVGPYERNCLGSSCMAYGEHIRYTLNKKRAPDSDEPVCVEQVISYCCDLGRQ